MTELPESIQNQIKILKNTLQSRHYKEEDINHMLNLLVEASINYGKLLATIEEN